MIGSPQRLERAEADDEIAHDKIDDLVSDPHREAREGGLIYI